MTIWAATISKVSGRPRRRGNKRMIVGEIPYEPTDPTVDRQIVTLKTLGADVF